MQSPSQSTQAERELREMVRKTVSPYNRPLTDPELDFYIAQCRRVGLDPLLKHANMIERGGKLQFEITIDGYRLIAELTGEYAGSDAPAYTGYKTLTNGIVAAKVCQVTVYRIVQGIRCPTTGEAHLDEFSTYLGMWMKMPKRLLAVRAEENALKKAFPKQLAGVYTTEEMDDAEERDKPAIRNAPQSLQEPRREAIEAKVNIPPSEESEGLGTAQTNYDEPSDELKLAYRKFVTATKTLGIPFDGIGSRRMQEYLRFLMGSEDGYNPKTMTPQDWREVEMPILAYISVTLGYEERQQPEYTVALCNHLYQNNPATRVEAITAVQWTRMAEYLATEQEEEG